MKRILLLALSAAPLVAAPAPATENLGRLFFTPQQRQELDRRRTANAQEALVIQENSVTLKGRVSRSSGKSTTWINDVPQHDAYSTPDPSRVTLPGGEGEPPVSLKIGQTRDRVRGETRDGLGGGKIEVLGEQRRNRKP
jgi:hypothetical protein